LICRDVSVRPPAFRRLLRKRLSARRKLRFRRGLSAKLRCACRLVATAVQPLSAELRFAYRPPVLPGKTGGGERARTVDLRLAKPALSQLSYTPVQITVISDQSSETASGPGRLRSLRRHSSSDYCFLITDPWKLVGQGGFEPPTSRLSSARSNQLSY
jgi:hypothetical protein